MNLLPQFYKFKTLAAYAYNISLSYTSIILYFSLSYIKQAKMIIMSSKLTLRIGQNWEKIKGQKRYKRFAHFWTNERLDKHTFGQMNDWTNRYNF